MAKKDLSKEVVEETLGISGSPDLRSIAPTLRSLAVRIDGLRLDERNARLHPEKNLRAIERSLSEYGQQKPIVVDRDGVVIAGNGTLAAARSLGWQYIAASTTNLSGDAARLFAIADNRTAELAEWDRDQLAEILREIPEEKWVGFDADSLAATLEVGKQGKGRVVEFFDDATPARTNHVCPKCGFDLGAGGVVEGGVEC